MMTFHDNFGNITITRKGDDHVDDGYDGDHSGSPLPHIEKRPFHSVRTSTHQSLCCKVKMFKWVLSWANQNDVDVRDTWLMKSDENLVPERYWILKTGQLHFSLVWYIGSKYGWHKQIFGDLSEEGASVVLVASSANWYCGGVKDALEWKDFSRWEEISPTETEIYARLSVFPPNTNTDLHPICNAVSPALFSYLSWEGGSPSRKKTSVKM